MVSAETRQIGSKNGTGRHLLVDEKGVPLGLALVGANRHDVRQLEVGLDIKIAHQPGTAPAVAENLCADAGYIGEKADAIATSRSCARTERRSRPGRTNASSRAAGLLKCHTAGFNLFRKLKVRYEKTTANSFALHHLSAATIALRCCRSKTGKTLFTDKL